MLFPNRGDIYMNYKFTLKQAREYAGLTRKEVASEFDMKEANYAIYENYNRYFKIDMAYKFANLTGIDFDDIYFLEPELHLKCKGVTECK